MIVIENKEECCGCSACESICPKGCIQMEPDKEGFWYPVVHKESCIDCGLCEKASPIKNIVGGKREEDAKYPKAYALPSLDSFLTICPFLRLRSDTRNPKWRSELSCILS